MKFIFFENDMGKAVGVLKDTDKIVPLKALVKDAVPADMNDVIENFTDEAMKDLEKKAEASEATISLSDVKVLAPIEYPKRHIFCLGKNYLDHANETKGLPGGSDDIPQFPIYFSKVAHPAIGQGENVLAYQAYTEKVDYEVELAVVIGKDGIDIAKEDAESHIFGYTIINDISARNIQRKHGQWFKGKSMETYCPMGPVLVHKSEIPFPVELDIKCSINGELRQNSNTNQLIFDIPTIIHDLSKGMYLRKGDIISTGTPAGVGLGFTPFKFLKPGDVMECYVEKIGTLTNTFGKELE
jgi:2-keto-4-pentenoate hydratase/2-oxohepta-3-ene-1,7-dioic acid hydratase in catechol pathway